MPILRIDMTKKQKKVLQKMADDVGTDIPGVLQRSFALLDIALKEHKGEYKWPIGSALFMINHSLYYYRHWERRMEALIYEKMENIGYEESRAQINLALKWFKDCFGEKRENPIPYQVRIFRAIMIFYGKLRDQKLLSEFGQGKGNAVQSKESPDY